MIILIIEIITIIINNDITTKRKINKNGINK